MSAIALIVDDHALFRSAAGDLLKAHCAFDEILEAESLDEAVDILGAISGISLAVFDLSMPGMMSAASLRSVRENFPDIRVAVLTGSNVRRDIFLALDAGIHGFILKTADPATIAQAFRWIMAGNIYIPPEIARTDAEPVIPLAPASNNPVDKLTPRQREILRLLSTGKKSNKELARELNLTENTIKVHVIALYRALRIHDRRQIPGVLNEKGVLIDESTRATDPQRSELHAIEQLPPS